MKLLFKITIVIIFVYSCSSNSGDFNSRGNESIACSERDFFTSINQGYSLEKEHLKYFPELNSFFLSKIPVKKLGHCYYKLNNLLGISGYLRKEKNKIILLYNDSIESRATASLFK